MGHLLEMIKNIFADDINELDEEFKTNIIPYFLNDIPQDVIAEISNEISHHSNID